MNWPARWAHFLAHLLGLNHSTLRMEVGRCGVEIGRVCSTCGKWCGDPIHLETRLKRRHQAVKGSRTR